MQRKNVKQSSTSSSENRLNPRSNRGALTSLSNLDGLNEGSLLSDFTIQRTDLPLANDGFNRMINDMNKLANLHENLSSQFAHSKNNRRSSRSYYSESSLNKTNQYAEILSKRGFFCKKLAESVKEAPVDGTIRYKAQIYEAFPSYINEKLQGTIIKADHKAEDNKSCQAEIDQIEARNNLFSNLLKDDDEEPVMKNVPDQSKQLFQDAKVDLEYILTTLYSDEDKKIIASVLQPLTEAYIKNLDSKEDQYVEIPITALRNQGVCCMIEGGIMVEHPQNPKKFRFCI